MPIITLTTDFGMRDGYVGAVKGVISRSAPQATIVDIAHDIPRGDIAHAAWVVKTSTLEFPRGTIHVVVVDPGVGGARDGVIVQVPQARQVYVGPDNGAFAYLPIDKAWTINPSEVVPSPSPTFHGRDVFAHAAAALASGSSSVYGIPTQLRGELPWGLRREYVGRVVHIDAFGNLITDMPAGEASEHVHVQERLLPVARTYEDVESGALLAYIGSAGTVEIAVRDGRADERLAAKRGDDLVHSVLLRTKGPYR